MVNPSETERMNPDAFFKSETLQKDMSELIAMFVRMNEPQSARIVQGLKETFDAALVAENETMYLLTGLIFIAIRLGTTTEAINALIKINGDMQKKLFGEGSNVNREV